MGMASKQRTTSAELSTRMETVTGGCQSVSREDRVFTPSEGVPVTLPGMYAQSFSKWHQRQLADTGLGSPVNPPPVHRAISTIV